MLTYDRYSQFRSDDNIKIVPFIKITPKSTDYFEVYEKGRSRLDIISYKYYNNSSYGWLILQANPEVGSMEYSIPDGSTLRIPYPLGETIEKYRNSVETYFNMYGNN